MKIAVDTSLDAVLKKYSKLTFCNPPPYVSSAEKAHPE